MWCYLVVTSGNNIYNFDKIQNFLPNNWLNITLFCRTPPGHIQDGRSIDGRRFGQLRLSRQEDEGDFRQNGRQSRRGPLEGRVHPGLHGGRIPLPDAHCLPDQLKRSLLCSSVTVQCSLSLDFYFSFSPEFVSQVPPSECCSNASFIHHFVAATIVARRKDFLTIGSFRLQDDPDKVAERPWRRVIF